MTLVCNCTRCGTTGFLNLEQITTLEMAEMENSDDFHGAVLAWMDKQVKGTHDVQVCDCCGDGEGWYGTPGEHRMGEPCDCR